MAVSWDFGRVAYGGDYYPEQWDAQTVDADIELMQQAQVNLVSLGIFGWARLEPTEGNYQLDWIGDVIERLYAAGISVDLATGTASPPVWMAKNHPETLPVNAQGVRLGFGSRQQYCPSNPYFRDKAAQLAAQMAKRFGAHPAVKLWHVSNEFGCHVPACYCDTCAQAFREWLQERYGSVADLNAAWGTDFWSQRYGSFTEVNPPREMPTFPNPSQILDWKRFSNHAILACHRLELEQLRKYSPQVSVTTNFMGPYEPTDYWEWSQYVDVVSDDSYPDPANPSSAAQVALEADLARSYHYAPFILMEQATGAVQWRPVNSPRRPGQNQLWSLQRVAHGADGILHFQWRQSRAGAETFHSAMVPHSGRDSRIFREVVDLGQALAKLDGVVGQPLDTPVAIVWGWQEEWALTSAVWLRPVEFARALRKWHRTLYEAGFAVDVVSPADLSRLSQYRLLIVPELFAAAPALFDALAAAAREGAQIVVAGPTGVVDYNCRAYTGEEPFPLETLTGVRVSEPWAASEPELRDRTYPAPDPRVDRITAGVNTPAQVMGIELQPAATSLEKVLERISSPRPALQGWGWAERLQVTGADVEVLAQYSGSGAGADLAGLPAITRRAIGAGGCFYAGVDLDAAGRAALVKLAAVHARVAPPVPDLPGGVEGVRRGRYLFLLNHSDRAVQLPGIVGKELLSGAQATGQLVLPPRSAAVVEAE